MAPPLSIVLKPLAGLDDGLESNLRTDIEQTYPKFELIFAVRLPSDPAVAVCAQAPGGIPACRHSIAVRWRASLSERESLELASHDGGGKARPTDHVRQRYSSDARFSECDRG